MRSRRARPLLSLLATIVLAACGGSGVGLAPSGRTLDPSCGDNRGPTPLVVHGTFPVKAVVSLTGSDRSELETSYRAWIGDAELGDVQWKDVNTLTAVVPAGIAEGVYPLVLESPFGTRGRVENAFRVRAGACPPPGPALVTTAQVTPGAATVGQIVTLTAVVQNIGLSAASRVTAAVVSPPAGVALVGDVPGPRDIPGGQSASYAWTYRATKTTGSPGVFFAVDAAGVDPAGASVASDRAQTNLLLVNAGAQITAQVLVPAAVNVGQPIQLSLVVTNTGAAPAAIAPTVNVVASNGARVVAGPAPVAQWVPGPGQQTFEWTFVAQDPCSVTFAVALAAADVNSGVQLTAAPLPEVAVRVQRPAALATTVAVAPLVPVLGAQVPQRTVAVTASVQNGGETTASGVKASIAPPAGLDLLSGPAGPRDIPGGGSWAFTWTYGVASSPGGTFAVDTSGVDVNTHEAVSAPRVVSDAILVQYTVGGSVTGLDVDGLALVLNGIERLAVPAGSAVFRFTQGVASGAAYSVTVGSQPRFLHCVLDGGAGTVGTAPVTSVVVTCG